MSTPRVYVIHENPEWFPPLAAAFEAEGVPVQEVLLTEGQIDLGAEPEPGVYWSRMSASSHTRGHEHSKEYTRALLGWLERAGRQVVGGSHVLELEVSKVAQHGLLRAAGFDVPRTTAVFGTTTLKQSAATFTGGQDVPFITKHNQGGKGLGVRRFDSLAEFDAYVDSPEFEAPVDGITLLQEYLTAREPFITRAEFVGGEFVYAVRVDTSAGSFELCPADACEVPSGENGPQGIAGAVCEVPGTDGTTVTADTFSVRSEVTAEHPLVQQLRGFLADQRIQIAGVEFMETTDGRTVVYDINTNTNYNPAVEAVAPASGPRSIARFLGGLLDAEYAAAAAPTHA
ncbi:MULTISPECIES: RimK family alpha-L-glutamate ligase [unclassified Curtobacterium]|uniref:ATP-grasp domain-containing protein n=1 Tax=unclassified Curtobacterium TaxID=257496 RepID=UPI000D81C03C|nr:MULTISPECIES: alpha-L-glutamate ligase [unclassified Curtobacterium]PYY32145.1 alpha-L-glutamate ligase [Curtobacterium sp. MCBD17_030]PZE34284.1 alpha-L-glutamate ligase [Curtobacterium sp. MCPF17_031]